MIYLFKPYIFVFYLPKLGKCIAIKARNESCAVHELCYRFQMREDLIENYQIMSSYKRK